MSAGPPPTNELEDLAAAATALSTTLRTAPATIEGLSNIATAIYELSIRIRIVARWSEAFATELDRAIARAKSIENEVAGGAYRDKAMEN